jgi:hypothetical protein
MANLIGYMQGNRGETSRLGSNEIHSQLETWQGAIHVSLDKDGNYSVRIGEKGYANRLVVEGNVNNKTSVYYGND